MSAMSSVRLKAAGMLAGLSLLLSGCFLQPGTFASQLTLLANNEFTFTYEGEIYVLGLAQLLAEQQKSQTQSFEAYCYGPEPEDAEMADELAEVAVETVSDERLITVEIAEASEYGSRECTDDEEAEQRAEWEDRQELRRERDKEQMDQISNIFGGIDPTDADAEKELAKRLERQKGFDKVVSKGNGLFDVSYSIGGTLTHDFMFPMMEGFPTNSPFLQMFVRDGNVVRINAPALAAPSSMNPTYLYLLGSPVFGTSEREELFANMPTIDGTFTIVTDGEIRANNTDEGPSSKDGRQELTWEINSRTTVSPSALIAMTN
ncbi:MAG: hypothetical protein ABJP70_11985 [Erythrobacter sp.]